MKSSWRSELLTFFGGWSLGLCIATLLARLLLDQQFSGDTWLIMQTGGLVTALVVTITKSERLPQHVRPLIWLAFLVAMIIFILLSHS
jgi:hypothetical protein